MLVATILLPFFTIFTLITSKTFLSCIASEKAQIGQSLEVTNNVSTFSSLLGYRYCIGLYVTNNSSAIVSLFTVLLFFATLALWWSTSSLVVTGETSAARQQRAYLAINPKSVVAFKVGDFIQIECIPKNHGLTPAIITHSNFQYSVLPYTLPSGFEFPKPLQFMKIDMTIFPDSNQFIFFNRDESLTQEELSEINKKDAAIYFWGVVYYLDVFDKKHEAHFNVIAGGDDFLNSIRAVKNRRHATNWNWRFGPKHNFTT